MIFNASNSCCTAQAQTAQSKSWSGPVWLIILLLLGLLSACSSGASLEHASPYAQSGKGSEPGGAANPAGQAGISNGLSRADPGYMQYLEKQSMLGKSTEMTEVVSGSVLNWRLPGSHERAADLRGRASVWVHIQPQAMLVPSHRSPFTQLTGPIAWDSLTKAGISGVYLAPTGGSGSLWDSERSRRHEDHEDVIQYDFPLHLGKDEDYRNVVRSAGLHQALLGGDIIPAAPGIGPDFFLAARAFREYPGLFCMAEAPREIWNLLPPVEEGRDWQVWPLSPEQAAAMEAKGFLPAEFAQEALDYMPQSGWAATGPVRGADGNLRRWVFRYFTNHKRPVLNWSDPSATARRAMNGSVIRQVGIFGNALSGYRVQPFIGLERYNPQVSDLTLDLAFEASLNLSRQTRSYGGWSWLRDELPLPLLREFLLEGPDFAQDNIFSPAAEHALLTGDAALLRFMADEALAYGLDFRRLVHSSVSHEGMNYLLPHLRYLRNADVAGQSAPDYRQSDRSMPERRPSRTTQAQAAELYRQIITQALSGQPEFSWFNLAGADLPGPDRATVSFEGSEQRVYSTSTGIAAAALGIGPEHKLTFEDKEEIGRGHRLLIFFKAMQPGLLMLSGQDLVGLMPLSWKNLYDKPENWDPRLATQGTYALLGSSQSVMINSLGMPRAESLYGPIDIQTHNPDSFLSRLGIMLAAREASGVAEGELAGRLKGTGEGLIALAIKLPDQQGWLISLSNFSRFPIRENLRLNAVPGLEQAARGGKASLLYGELDNLKLRAPTLNFTIQGWGGALILIRDK
ncbi:MAG: hypothetical protein LBV80_09370 [Deltaproteobacteria bacterium]|nr:hypothetical protein [Deltaproteobacteria bacterium]